MNKKQQKILVGIMLIIVGAALAYWGYDVSQSLSNQFARAFSGSSAGQVIAAYAAGAILSVTGIFMLFFTRK